MDCLFTKYGLSNEVCVYVLRTISYIFPLSGLLLDSKTRSQLTPMALLQDQIRILAITTIPKCWLDGQAFFAFRQHYFSRRLLVKTSSVFFSCLACWLAPGQYSWLVAMFFLSLQKSQPKKSFLRKSNNLGTHLAVKKAGRPLSFFAVSAWCIFCCFL